MDTWEKKIEEALNARGMTLETLPERYTPRQRQIVLNRAHYWGYSESHSNTYRHNLADYLCHQNDIIQLLIKALGVKGDEP